jgi:hypothetical protein
MFVCIMWKVPSLNDLPYICVLKLSSHPKKLIFQEILRNLVEKTIELYVLLQLTKSLLATTNFDL